MSNDDLSNLIYKPFESFRTRLIAHESFCRMVTVAVSEMRAMPELLRALQETTKSDRADDIADAEKMATIASEEVESGFATLFNSAAVYIWGALETAIRDLSDRDYESILASGAPTCFLSLGILFSSGSARSANNLAGDHNDPSALSGRWQGGALQSHCEF